MAFRRCLALAPVAIVLLAACVSADNIDLPVATSGFEKWAGVVGKALAFGGGDKDQTLQSLSSFQETVMQKMKSKALSLQKMSHGDFTDVITSILDPSKVSIGAPVFFSNAPSVIANSIAATQIFFTGVGYAPCAVPITPTGVGIFPQGINIQPEAFNIAPTGVNVQPQGLSIGPTLIVIGPYDTTVAGQGLNIAPALISIAPTKTVVNPVGPLAISDTLIAATVPALPGP